jgi:hypothetical protein
MVKYLGKWFLIMGSVIVIFHAILRFMALMTSLAV